MKILLLLFASSISALSLSLCSAFTSNTNFFPTAKIAGRAYTTVALHSTKRDAYDDSRRAILQQIPSLLAATTTVAGISRTDIASAAESNNDDLSYLGPLASLVGTWSGSGGLSITGVPSRKSNPDDKGVFELIVRPYKEILTIEAIPGPIKQRGGSIEQFSGVVTYKKKVWATDDDPELIHVEDGMLFYLDNVEVYSDGTPSGILSKNDKQPFSIARSATVPHGNSAMLFGNFKTNNGPPVIPDIDTRPVPTIDGIGYDSIFNRSKYNAINPNINLQHAVSNQKISKTMHIALDSKNDGAITNTAFINSRADTTGFKCDFWVETVEDKYGKVVDQLQYSEFVDIFFHRTEKNGKGDLIKWPHVMINTMIKES